MKANSMRGLYHPLTEDTKRAADRQGFVVISEVPAVDLKCVAQTASIYFANLFSQGGRVCSLGPLHWGSLGLSLTDPAVL